MGSVVSSVLMPTLCFRVCFCLRFHYGQFGCIRGIFVIFFLRVVLSLGCYGLVVSSGASDSLKRLVSKNDASISQ